MDYRSRVLTLGEASRKFKCTSRASWIIPDRRLGRADLTSQLMATKAYFNCRESAGFVSCCDRSESEDHAVREGVSPELADARNSAGMNFRTEDGSGTWPNRQKNQLV
jgi:hypothetical protein